MTSPFDPTQSVAVADEGPKPGPTRTRVALGIGACVLGCAALAGLAFAIDAATKAERSTFEITGVLTVDASLLPAGDCAGSADHRDVLTTAVTVSDASGTVLGQGRLDDGTRSERACTFTFSVPDVPRGHELYEVEVGRSGGVSYTEQEARAGLTLTLGK